MSATKQYELVYIAAPEATEQQLAELHELVVGIAAKFNGTIDRTEAWGRRRLAYEIGPHKEGVYVLELINGSGDLMKEIDRRLRVLDQVVRHIVVRVDEEKKVVDRTRTKRQTESERRRVKRGLPPVRQPGEGRRFNMVRYDTPEIAGFTATANWGEDDAWEVGLRYKGELGDFKLAAAIAYGDSSDVSATSR